MRSSTLVLAATIATAVYAQNIPREKFSRKSVTSNNKQVHVITGGSKNLKRQDAVSNGTAGAEIEEEEPEEEEEEESESESESESSSSEEEDEGEEEEEEEEEETSGQEAEPEGQEEEEEEEPEPSGQEAEATGQGEEEALPAMEGGATSAVSLIDGPSGQIAMGMGVENADGSCTCNAACPAGSLPM
ncbi:hypothetical protein FJTKL_07625 [Diaporthe vaccinii]|uniref:Uncharacterized protein n=1 Tax=Diaporthe vaccinii TaxID=105482 RepID=A0ABR4ETG3_9PEZI